MATKLYIIDALGPFFVNEKKRDTVNWSKVVFADIETDGRLPSATRMRILKNFDIYLDRVMALGYDSISIDDLAHLVNLPFYAADLQALLNDYGKLYKQIVARAKQRNLRVFINTDFLFFNDDIHAHLQTHHLSPVDFYQEVLAKAMHDFPEIDGVILRVGEKDGNDVTGPFLSTLLLKTPADANQLLRKIIPLFEQYNKLLIFRTWTVGAYKIGDLIWNEKTYDAVFSSINSDALIISMKFGDTDFMRYLALNPLFFHGPHKKILELQTRREWEGMGTYPSFVGWDYQQYIERLAGNETVIGIHVWCQTGGWAKKEWSNLTYLRDSSFWNELNTEVTIAIAKDGLSAEQAIALFCKRRAIDDATTFTELLRLSEIAVKKGLYIADLAKKTFYFRRTRIPPLMWLTWDKIYLPSIVIRLHRMLLPRHSSIVTDGEEAVAAAEKMIELASKIGLERSVIDSLRFERATLATLAKLRHYIYSEQSAKDIHTINQTIRDYQKTYPQHYAISEIAVTKRQKLPRKLLSPFLRESHAYRKRDKIFLKTSPVQARFIRLYLKRSRSHLADQSMGLETLFK